MAQVMAPLGFSRRKFTNDQILDFNIFRKKKKKKSSAMFRESEGDHLYQRMLLILKCH